LFRTRRAGTLFVAETLLVVGTVLSSIQLRLGPSDAPWYELKLWKSLVVAAVVQLSLYYHDLYTYTGMAERRGLLRRLLSAFALAAVILWALYYAAPQLELGRGIFVINLALLVVVFYAFRRALVAVLDRPAFRRRLLIVGADEEAREVARLVGGHNELGLNLVGFLAPDRSPEFEDLASQIVGTYDDLPRACRAHRIDEIIVAPGEHRHLLPVSELVTAKFEGVQVTDAQAFFEKITGKISVHELSPTLMVFGVGFAQSRGTRIVKRIFDVACAAVGLLVAAPLMLLVAIAIKLDSRGPIFYSQERVGERGRLFRVHKFRSMRADAEATGAVWARPDDERVTRVGRFIRSSRLDELPQLWNVLRGEMSLVGPRPERPVFVEKLAREIPFYHQRHCVKPGVTGLAQVRYRYGASVEDSLEKLRYDLYYMKNLSLWYDLSVILDTVKVVLFRIGSR
jgi:sugar transferase (PEP-CTERM system associated)